MEKLDNSNKKEAHFLSQAIKFVKGRGYESYCAVIDCMAVAYAIDSSIIETIRGKVGIETKGELTLGNTVLERRLHHALESLSEIDIAVEADYKKFLTLLMNIVLK